jgi:hypothetical protein
MRIGIGVSGRLNSHNEIWSPDGVDGRSESLRKGRLLCALGLLPGVLTAFKGQLSEQRSIVGAMLLQRSATRCLLRGISR